MATLSEKHKSFIVMHLACYETPSKVREAVKENFGTEVSLPQLSYYNPRAIQASSQLAEKWVDLFNETRSRYIEDVTDIPVSQKVYRLKRLQENLDNFAKVRNYKGVNECLEQAAKEMGGAFTNKNHHQFSGLLQSIDMNSLTDHQLRRITDGEHPLAVLAGDAEG
ncbi:MAG: hypothetical protein CL670_04845 [Balneola sp.]|jgi:hypothetical protein|nr:hypothetical protein [Balneola sp.]MBE78459.1 hypothetical protein [Balneola sp.]|tara:strand:- start:277 stop:774 length:498 start_codon:yes stop_codon:yes gene_type:complete